jgi:mRNA interferase HigB
MRIISTKILSDYWISHPETQQPLKAWCLEVKHSQWKTSNDVIIHYPKTDPIGDNRVVFNIKGNKYRLIVKIHYNTGIVYVRFIGTHAEYDRIDAEKI